MVECGIPKPSGRTNPEASDQTRRALLDAALECIADLGYAKATTTEIARRAGVSRGAQRYHFPAKTDLMAAAVHHLFANGTEDFVHRFRTIDRTERTLDRAVDLMWTMFSDNSIRAGLELIVAGSNEPALQSAVHTAVEAFGRDVRRVKAEFFPDEVSLPLADAGTVFAFAVVFGSSIYRTVGLDRYADQSLAVLRALSRTKPLAAPALYAEQH